MGNDDYDEEILKEDDYIVELSNRGELKKHNPNFYNSDKELVQCVSPECKEMTKSTFSTCKNHKKLVDYPLHEKDWVGRVILPGKTREECKTWALPHGKIARLLVRWVGNNEVRRKKMDEFINEAIKKIHGKIPDATTFQKMRMGEIIEDGMSPDDFVNLTKEIVEKHFPESECKGDYIEGEDMRFKGLNFGKMPLRVVLASLILALGCEESNRGDSWGVSRVGMKPRYANIYMPLGSYLMMDKGATDAEAKMSLR